MAYTVVAKHGRLHVLLSLLLIAFVTTSVASTSSPRDAQGEAVKTRLISFNLVDTTAEISQPIYEPENQKIVHLSPGVPSEGSSSIFPEDASTNTASYSLTEANILQDLHSSLSTMQDHYFEVWIGKYTTAIDWTGAVVSTYVSATLSTLSQSLSYTMPGTFDKSRKLDVEAQMVENEINKYFAQTSAYYFGEDHFAIRMQAFDDMLWVVLGWLEATMFIESHSDNHYMPDKASGKAWHASQFVPAFAHRARVFYELAEKGWDWRLCGGGMTWNPRLLPYKNAITNQLFISASISMYLHFPGDENCSPFLTAYDASRPQEEQQLDDCDEQLRGRFDPVYLANAINGYNWLRNSGMLNDQGLYTDGFHITGYRTNHSKTVCDDRNEMVYTYNQGVVLSGLRGLWEATGNTSYLEDGHALVRNVIRATGWDSSNLNSAFSKQSDWHGLGAQGILTEYCDPTGHCNQDAQSFKGIFFHHLTAFCAPLPLRALRPGKTHAATRETAHLHRNSCSGYTAWVTHNARAALRTRDARGRFGGWWGAPSSPAISTSTGNREEMVKGPSMRQNATDYRNGDFGADEELYKENTSGFPGQVRVGTMAREKDVRRDGDGDLNDRGRGRTIETQGSGVAVVRAMWVFMQRADGGAG
ncbi:glycoside hydrolase family 76 protein [Curvularia clavata]|uniref:Glycoside hydrolase family 76 protein n=1 Tax=Curvularia clavata TaxID=95742 RepID=A0A9Q8Z7L7_CURCL|nr:glycoside hydrolase family 76 protein [Curvularia clavata]